jgi:Kef-type K+ transport system membrane component KefB
MIQMLLFYNIFDRFYPNIAHQLSNGVALAVCFVGIMLAVKTIVNTDKKRTAAFKLLISVILLEGVNYVWMLLLFTFVGNSEQTRMLHTIAYVLCVFAWLLFQANLLPKLLPNKYILTRTIQDLIKM